jgi:hypothetical protein
LLLKNVSHFTPVWLEQSKPQFTWLDSRQSGHAPDEEARLFATEIIGHLFGYAQATNTRALSLVGDANAHAYELLFSFASSEGKERRFTRLSKYKDC